MSVWWKTKNWRWGFYKPRIHWVERVEKIVSLVSGLMVSHMVTLEALVGYPPTFFLLWVEEKKTKKETVSTLAKRGSDQICGLCKIGVLISCTAARVVGVDKALVLVVHISSSPGWWLRDRFLSARIQTAATAQSSERETQGAYQRVLCVYGTEIDTVLYHSILAWPELHFMHVVSVENKYFSGLFVWFLPCHFDSAQTAVVARGRRANRCAGQGAWPAQVGHCGSAAKRSKREAMSGAL
jgi:hypothetical protein